MQMSAPESKGEDLSLGDLASTTHKGFLSVRDLEDGQMKVSATVHSVQRAVARLFSVYIEESRATIFKSCILLLLYQPSLVLFWLGDERLHNSHFTVLLSFSSCSRSLRSASRLLTAAVPRLTSLGLSGVYVCV
jgi:hypothetical protein